MKYFIQCSTFRKLKLKKYMRSTTLHKIPHKFRAFLLSVYLMKSSDHAFVTLVGLNNALRIEMP